MRNNLLHYLLLLLGVSVSAFFFIFFKGNYFAEVIIVGLGCTYYALWGIIHHELRDRLTRLIALEYILVASIIFLLLFTSLAV